MLSHTQHFQKGVTLVELMIGLTVGLIVIAVVGTLFITTLRGSDDTLRSMKLNQELRAVANYMVADIRRAGYWAGGATSTNPEANPYMVRTGVATDIFAGNGCIMYSYDLDDTGSIPRYAFRLREGSIQVPQSTALGGGTNTDCAEDGWENLTSPNTVVIDQLTFGTEGSQCRNLSDDDHWEIDAAGATIAACAPNVTIATASNYEAPDSGDQLIETRQIKVQLVGHHAAAPDTRITIEESIRLPNNRVLKAP